MPVLLAWDKVLQSVKDLCIIREVLFALPSFVCMVDGFPAEGVMPARHADMTNGIHLLLIDDNEPLVTSIKAVIAVLRPSWTILTALSAADGLALLAKERVDVALVDIKLPDMAGLELCQRIKRRSSAPVLVFSGAAWEMKERVRDSGPDADGYLNKPLSPLELVERIEGALRRVA
jgi:two-component system response regulator MtrA